MLRGRIIPAGSHLFSLNMSHLFFFIQFTYPAKVSFVPFEVRKGERSHLRKLEKNRGQPNRVNGDHPLPNSEPLFLCPCDYCID